MSRSSRSNKEHNLNAEGSPKLGEPLYLSIGRLRRPHGLSGEMIMDVYTDFPDRIQKGRQVFLGLAKEPKKIKNFKHHGAKSYIAFEGVMDLTQAANYRNTEVFISADNLPELSKGYYYHHQLLGCVVVDENQRCLGKLEEIIQTGSRDVYVVRDPEGEAILLPAMNSVILNVDLESNEITVRLLEWE